ncbi:MAG: hypothetical protein ABIR58_05775 [Gemmatimonadaceae bacterium]
MNLVIAKPVYSYVTFWQMIGRGTRVLEADPSQRKPWCPEKDRFLECLCFGDLSSPDRNVTAITVIEHEHVQDSDGSYP